MRLENDLASNEVGECAKYEKNRGDTNHLFRATISERRRYRSSSRRCDDKLQARMVSCRCDLTFKCVTVRRAAGGRSKAEAFNLRSDLLFLTDAESPLARIVADRERPRTMPITFASLATRDSHLRDFPLRRRRLKTILNASRPLPDAGITELKDDRLPICPPAAFTPFLSFSLSPFPSSVAFAPASFRSVISDEEDLPIVALRFDSIRFDSCW